MNFLVVHRGLRDVVRVLRRAGKCRLVHDLDEAHQLLLEGEGSFDAVLLDLALPQNGAWTLLEELRQRGSPTPVIVVPEGGSRECVRALRMGADDYIPESVDPAEFAARIEAIIRRNRSLPVWKAGDITINLARRIAQRGQEVFNLTPKEFDLLFVLTESRGRVVRREVLLKKIWNLNFDPGTAILEVLASRLRRKLGRSGPSLIEKVRDKGYRLVDETSLDS